MTGYMDMTFCPFWETCLDGKECFRALTHSVRAGANVHCDGRIAQFVEPPGCYKLKLAIVRQEENDE